MQRVSIDEVRPAMVLAVTIKDNNGNILFLKGVELTDRHTVLLNNRDIRKVVVEGRPVKREENEIEKLHKEIDERFVTAGPNSIVLKIRDIIKDLLT
ncbi:MAG TPA: hypothetical protein DHV16_03935 [Nitrospiraceae bacterium]|nr:MAG: hypothetical protein A2X55_10415 [Nitrospirae bacterium GWB2_47_37]HAK88184.1 hypothetical protein [Nitrospiraceae bacterium]HCL81946.1 hypothetical protein [Nitrospiraceae bacterium]HCZ11406.1 hypothetical protein [Nitrospiraceae bacterium]